MTVAELDDYLTDRGQDFSQEQEKFSKYLYKLEQKKRDHTGRKGIFTSVFTAYFVRWKKSDGAVIGSLSSSGRGAFFKNLLTFVRTGKVKGLIRGWMTVWAHCRKSEKRSFH